MLLPPDETLVLKDFLRHTFVLAYNVLLGLVTVAFYLFYFSICSACVPF